MNETITILMFTIQALAILAGVYMGFKFGKDQPLIEKKDKMMDMNDFAIPEEEEKEFPVEEPYISWPVKEKDYGEAEEK